MKKQVSILLGICAGTKYLLCDETFDGLDPVVRQGVKSLFAGEMADRGLTPVIASHNLRELEDVCDHIGLIHSGGIVLEKELDEAKLGIHRVQAVFDNDVGEGSFANLNVVKMSRQGKLFNMTIRGTLEEVEQGIKALDPVYMEMLPLTLEEVFISEMEVVGYDIDNILK